MLDPLVPPRCMHSRASPDVLFAAPWTQDPKALEDLTGLTELHAATSAMADDFELDDSELDADDENWTTL